MRNRVWLLFLMVSNFSLAGPQSFSVDEITYYDCKYLKFLKSKWTISQSCGTGNADPQQFCVGSVSCRYTNKKNGEEGTNYRMVGCEATSDGKCPSPIDCYLQEVKFLTEWTAQVEIQSAEAGSNQTHSKTSATSSHSRASDRRQN